MPENSQDICTALSITGNQPLIVGINAFITPLVSSNDTRLSAAFLRTQILVFYAVARVPLERSGVTSRSNILVFRVTTGTDHAGNGA